MPLFQFCRDKIKITEKNPLNHFFILNFYMHFSVNIFRTKYINYNTYGSMFGPAHFCI